MDYKNPIIEECQKTERVRQETERQFQETDRQIKAVNKQICDYGYNFS